MFESPIKYVRSEKPNFSVERKLSADIDITNKNTCSRDWALVGLGAAFLTIAQKCGDALLYAPDSWFSQNRCVPRNTERVALGLAICISANYPTLRHGFSFALVVSRQVTLW
jgi:hypothetical protein